MRALTTKAIKDVTRRKLRTSLTVLGIAVGVMGLTAVGIASTQLKATLQSTEDTNAVPDVQFFSAPASAAAAGDLSRQPNVSLVQAATFVPGRWSIPTGHEEIDITGLPDLSSVPFNKFTVTTGSLPGPNQILMETGDRSVSGFQVGDQIQLQVNGGLVSLRVSGLAQTPGVPSSTLSGRAFAYMHQADLQSIYHLSGPNLFQVRLHDYGQRTASAKELATTLEADNVPVLQTIVGHDITGGGSGILDGLFAIMAVLSVIALLLSVFLLLSTITTLLAEQVRVIGTMKAMGARRGQVVRHYLAGVAIYGVAGTLLGFALGVLGGGALVSSFGTLFGLYGTSVAITPGLVVEAIVVGVGLPMLAALIPLLLGTRTTVQQALSGYGIEHRGVRRRAVVSRLIARAARVMPQTVQLGVRNLFRRRTRAALTVIALAMSGAAFLAVQTTSASFNNVLDQVFASYHADVIASLNNPQPSDKVNSTIARVSGIQQSEPSDFMLADTTWGQAEIVGLRPNTQVYRKNVLQGRWFSGADQHVVLINEAIADKTGLTVGDSIDFHNDLYSGHWQIIGIERDYSNPLGLGVMLAPLSQVNAFQHLPTTFAQTLLLTSTSTKSSDIDALSKHVDDALGQAGLQASVTTAQEQITKSQAGFQIIYVLFYSVVVIIALVGAIGLSNALAMGIAERRREIGILRSMGATGRKVAQVFLAEGIGLGLVGWFVAVIIGLPAAYGFIALMSSVLLRVPFTFNPMSLVTMLIFIVIVASLASLGPVWAAARVKIAETLRYE